MRSVRPHPCVPADLRAHQTCPRNGGQNGDFMTTIRKVFYIAMLALSAASFTPSLAAAEAPAHGKFTLTHNVRWGNALVAAGDYEFSYDPYAKSPILTLTRMSGSR